MQLRPAILTMDRPELNMTHLDGKRDFLFENTDVNDTLPYQECISEEDSLSG